MGRCNCGHLAQTVTELSSAEIHRTAIAAAGDWRDQVLAHHDQLQGRAPIEVEVCTTTGRPLDEIIDQLLALGLTHDDLAHLERLTSPEILKTFPAHERHLDNRTRGDVISYLRRWVELLTTELARNSAPAPPDVLPALTPLTSSAERAIKRAA